jgi:hypothetical protein
MVVKTRQVALTGGVEASFTPNNDSKILMLASSIAGTQLRTEAGEPGWVLGTAGQPTVIEVGADFLPDEWFLFNSLAASVYVLEIT